MPHPKTVLDQYGIDTRQSLGQNFLFDDHILSRIAEAADLQSGDQVLEIGPGTGALTQHLAASGAQILAVELDDRLLPVLRDQLNDYTNIRLVHDDILSWEPSDHFDRSYKVVANVPYYITGAILRRLLSHEPRPSLMVLTVQKEVAERLAASPGDMSLLAVSVQLAGHVEILFTIKAGAFWPRPEVDSAVVRITHHSKPKISTGEEERFFRIVRAGFHQKRKQLQKNLRSLGYDKKQLAAALAEAGIDGRRRAETLSVEEWLTLCRKLP